MESQVTQAREATEGAEMEARLVSTAAADEAELALEPSVGGTCTSDFGIPTPGAELEPETGMEVRQSRASSFIFGEA
jgi:hypothetical protein